VSDDEEDVCPEIGADLNQPDCRPNASLDDNIIGERAKVINDESEIPGAAIFLRARFFTPRL
jgi:hypothetical protein